MKNNYQYSIIEEFISFVVPTGKKYIVVSEENKVQFLRQKKITYDYIILLFTLEGEDDISSFLKDVYSRLNLTGRIIIIYKNYLQSFIYGLLTSFHNSKRAKEYNWLSTQDIRNFLYLADFDPFLTQPLCLFPWHIPVVSDCFNKLLLYIFPFNHLSKLLCVVARKNIRLPKDCSVSVIIPARNEEGNIEKLFTQLPLLGSNTEVVFIEGHSKDNTKMEIIRCIKKYQNKLPFTFKLLEQNQGIGKADAVREGFANATGDILIIYDADMSVKPYELSKFYLALISNKGDFINGSRLVYPMRGKAMQFLNILGNKFFSIFYTWILGQTIKDTLCGTKVLWRKDYLAIRSDKRIFGIYDPFGDFELLLGASKLNLKIIDLPIRYHERTYGATNIKRFTNAFELLKFSFVAIKKLKMRLQ